LQGLFGAVIGRVVKQRASRKITPVTRSPADIKGRLLGSYTDDSNVCCRTQTRSLTVVLAVTRLQWSHCRM